MEQEIKIQMSGENAMYLPMADVPEHESYFCWTLEDAILTRIYYKKHNTIPTGDLIYAAILDYLGVDNSSPYDTDKKQICFGLALDFTSHN